MFLVKILLLLNILISLEGYIIVLCNLTFFQIFFFFGQKTNVYIENRIY